MKTLIEIVCCTVEDAIAAEAGGADRIELCSALQVGGLTPSLGLLRAVKAHTTIPVMAMIRPRPSGFCYSDSELAVMERDAEIALDNGADGIVVGCLTTDNKVDKQKVRLFIRISGERDTVFHRAFDLTPDWYDAMEQLILCGITRILTSGHAPTAIAGEQEIRSLNRGSAGRVQILPGGGIRARNVAEVVKRTGCNQVHLAPRTPRIESGVSALNGVDYGEDGMVTADAVAEVVRAVRDYETSLVQ